MIDMIRPPAFASEPLKDIYAAGPFDGDDDDPEGTHPTLPYLRATLPAPFAAESEAA